MYLIENGIYSLYAEKQERAPAQWAVPFL